MILPKQNIIFDLDGTLIDSGPAIISTLKKVCDDRGIVPKVRLDSLLIGPPLSEIIKKITCFDDQSQIAEICNSFAREYDHHGYKSTSSYEGVREMLLELSAANKQLFIVTNKRSTPTNRLVSHLGWSSIFEDRVFSLDSCEGRFANKAEVLSHVMVTWNIRRENSVYVGDRLEDMQSALACGVDFIPVSWGYGSWSDTCLKADVIESPDAILKHRFLKKGC